MTDPGSAPAFGAAPAPAKANSQLDAESESELKTITEFLKSQVDPPMTDEDIVGEPMRSVYELAQMCIQSSAGLPTSSALPSNGSMGFGLPTAYL